MHGDNGFGQPDGQANEAFLSHRSFGRNRLRQVATFDILSDQIWTRPVEVSVEVLGGAESSYSASSLNFSVKARSKVWVIGQFGPDELDRDLGTRRIFGQEDYAHTSSADTTTQVILAEMLWVLRLELIHAPSKSTTSGSLGHDLFLEPQRYPGDSLIQTSRGTWACDAHQPTFGHGGNARTDEEVHRFHQQSPTP